MAAKRWAYEDFEVGAVLPLGEKIVSAAELVDFARQFARPVRAGDRLTGRTTVVSKRPSKSRPELGLVLLRHELANQDGETVFEMENTGMFRLAVPA